ncbi:MAG: hypothetical protein K0S01_232 [Herbinix sp.]|jgi:hypothetical protein|nr:hypothetical protein [Herbinix sp.]
MEGDFDMKYLVNLNRGKKDIYTSRCIKSILIIIALLFTTLSEFTAAGVSAETNGSMTVTVNYLTEEATITTISGGSTKFYMSTDKMKTWEVVNAIVDISTLLVPKENIIYFKGNKDKNALSVTLPAEDSTFNATYQIVAGNGKIEFPRGIAVEYRKGANGAWKTALDQSGNPLFLASGSTAIFEVKGATLYFRTPATAIKRASKMVTVKISKRPSAPSVKMDGSKLSITGLKAKETLYRVGDSIDWKPFTPTDLKSKSIDLYTLFGSTSDPRVAFSAGFIEFCTLGTDKKLSSAIKVLEVPQQPTVPNTIAVSGSSITITDTDTTRTYEYTKVDKGSALNMSTARWSTVSTKKTLVVPKASVGDTILVRLKSRTDSVSKQLLPASTCYMKIIETIS